MKWIEGKKTSVMLAVFATLLWGSAFPTIKIAYNLLELDSADYLSKVLFAGLRFFGSGIILFAIFFKRLDFKSISVKGYAFKLFLVALFGNAMQYFFFYIGLSNSTGVKGSILTSLGTFFVMILAAMFLKDEHITKKKMIGLMIGFLGAAFIHFGDGFDFTFDFTGEGFLLITAFVSALSIIIVKQITTNSSISPVFIAMVQFLVGGFILISIGFTKFDVLYSKMSIGVALILIYQSFLSATAFSIWFSLIKHHKASRISMYKFLIPVFGSVLSVIFIEKENFRWQILVSLALVSIGVIVVNYNNAKSLSEEARSLETNCEKE